jgi:predicted HTH domain antitoxin
MGKTAMMIHFEIPESIEEQLRSSGIDPTQSAKELLLVDLYRKGKITHYELRKALSLSRYETDGVLKRHDVPIELSIEELRAETDFLERKSRE